MKVSHLLQLLCAALATVATAPGHECGHHGHRACAPTCQSCARQSVTGPATSAAAVAIAGRVIEVNYLPAATPDLSLVEIRIDGGAQPEWVRLAPAGYLRQVGLTLREGDFVDARGYRVAGADGTMVVATDIKAAGRTVQLRDGRGRQQWR